MPPALYHGMVAPWRSRNCKSRGAGLRFEDVDDGRDTRSRSDWLSGRPEAVMRRVKQCRAPDVEPRKRSRYGMRISGFDRSIQVSIPGL